MATTARGRSARGVRDRATATRLLSSVLPSPHLFFSRARGNAVEMRHQQPSRRRSLAPAWLRRAVTRCIPSHRTRMCTYTTNATPPPLCRFATVAPRFVISPRSTRAKLPNLSLFSSSLPARARSETVPRIRTRSSLLDKARFLCSSLLWIFFELSLLLCRVGDIVISTTLQSWYYCLFQGAQFNW